MPLGPHRPCSGCGALVRGAKSRCTPCGRAYQAKKNEGRGGSGWAWQQTREQVFKRDGYTCVVRDGTPHSGRLEAAHVIPIEEGGTSDLANLKTKCAEHHAIDTREHAERRATHTPPRGGPTPYGGTTPRTALRRNFARAGSESNSPTGIGDA